jgi:hypothetical protein
VRLLSVFILSFWSYWLLGLLPLLMFFYFYFLWLLFFRLCICFVDFSVWFFLLCNRSSYFLFTILGHLVSFFSFVVLFVSILSLLFYYPVKQIFLIFVIYGMLRLSGSHVSTCYGAARCIHVAVIAALADAIAGTRVRITSR